MKVTTSKEYNAAIDEAIRVGWTVSFGGRHPKLKSPSGRWCFSVPASPSDSKYGVKAFRTQLRRYMKLEGQI